MSLQTLPSPAVLGAKSELNLYQKEWCGDNEVIKLSKMLLGNKKLSFLGFRNCKRIHIIEEHTSSRFPSSALHKYKYWYLKRTYQHVGLSNEKRGECEISQIGSKEGGD